MLWNIDSKRNYFRRKTNMREIKFRGRTFDGLWVYGNLSVSPNEDDAYIVDPLDKDGGVYPVDIDTVGQLTGVLDKTQDEIYQGDIVLINGHKYVVIDEEGVFAKAIEEFQVDFDWTPIKNARKNNFDLGIEIIGNKWEKSYECKRK